MSQRRRDRARVREQRIVLLSRLSRSSAVSPSTDESPRRRLSFLGEQCGAGELYEEGGDMLMFQFE